MSPSPPCCSAPPLIRNTGCRDVPVDVAAAEEYRSTVVAAGVLRGVPRVRSIRAEARDATV